MRRMTAFTPVRRRLYAAAPVAVVFLAAASAWLQFYRMDLSRRLVEHTGAVIAEARGLARNLAEAEAAHRGYLIAGEDTYLPDYSAAIRRIETDTASLRKLTRDNVSQQARLDTLDGMLTRRLALLRHRIDVRRGGGRDVVTAEILAPGRALTDSVHGVVARLEDEEQGLLAERLASEARGRRLLIAVFMAGMAVVAVLAWLVNRAFAGYATAQDLALHQIADQNEELELSASRLQEQASELEEQRDELETQRDVLRSQTGELELLNTELSERTRIAEMAQGVAESERHRSTEILESISDAFFRVDSSWRIEYANGRAAELFGRPREELIGHELWPLTPTLDPIFERRLRGAMRNRAVTRFEEYSRGRGLYYAVALYPSETGMSVFLHDLTVERLAQADFRVLAETIPQLVWSATPEGRLDYRNDRFTEYTGLPATEVELLGWIECFHPDDAPAAVEAWQRSLAKGQPYNVEYRMRRASDGVYRWFAVQALPVRAPDGRTLHWFGTCTDVHEEREAAEAVRRLSAELRARVEELEALFEVLPVGVSIAHDASCRDIRANQAMARMLQVPAEENVSMGRPDPEVLPFRVFRNGKELPVDELPLQRAVAWKRAISGEDADIDLVFGDGSTRHIFVTAVPLLDEDGEARGSVGTFMDVTARMSAEAEVHRLAERNAKLYAFTSALASAYTREQVAAAAGEWGRGVFNACASFVTLLDDARENLETLFCAGMPDDFVARWRVIPMDTPLPMPDAVRSGGLVLLASRAERHATYPLMAWPDGLEAMIAAPLRFEGRALGAWALHFDSARIFSREDLQLFEGVTVQCALAMERARLFEAERQARQQAEQANQAKLKFLRVMSHDLRTPLNAILGYTELLQHGVQGPINATQFTYLDRILASTAVLRALIDDILEFARIEAGHVDIRLKEVQLLPLLNQVEDVVRPQVRAKNITLTTCECADLYVRADPERLRQILMNLVSNAQKFTPDGGEIVIDCQGDCGRVRVSVQDNGIGIPPEQLERIFEPFVQAHRPIELGTEQGVGLGLAISRELARAMGGDVFAEALEHGSRFTLDLAQAQVAVTAEG